MGEVANGIKTLTLSNKLSNYSEIITVLTREHASRTTTIIPMELFLNGEQHENVYHAGTDILYVYCKYINDTSIEIGSSADKVYCEVYVR